MRPPRSVLTPDNGKQRLLKPELGDALSHCVPLRPLTPSSPARRKRARRALRPPRARGASSELELGAPQAGGATARMRALLRRPPRSRPRAGSRHPDFRPAGGFRVPASSVSASGRGRVAAGAARDRGHGEAAAGPERPGRRGAGPDLAGSVSVAATGGGGERMLGAGCGAATREERGELSRSRWSLQELP